MNKNPFIKLKNVSFSYDDDLQSEAHPAINDLTLDIEEGSFVAVLGHNGSGKSTFAKLLNMILTPSGGEIYIDGTLITDTGLTDEDVLNVRKSIGMVFQNPDNQLVATVVEEDVAFGPENLGIAPDDIRRRVDVALEAVGMSEFKKHSPHQLSGGQKQRVAIAGIIAMMPKCIVFDESTAMLDPAGRREVMDTILKLKRKHNITVILITHYMNEAMLADRVIVMNEGNLLLDGTPYEVFKNTELIKKAGLDSPAQLDIIYELKALGHNIEMPVSLEINDCAKVVCDYYSKITKE